MNSVPLRFVPTRLCWPPASLPCPLSPRAAICYNRLFWQPARDCGRLQHGTCHENLGHHRHCGCRPDRRLDRHRFAQRNLAKNIVGIGRRQASLRVARRVGAVTHTTIDLNKGVADAELVIVCTPVAQIVEHVRQAASHCPERRS